MSILLPPVNHPARELIDIEHVAKMFASPNTVKMIPNGVVIAKAKEKIEQSNGAIVSINVICEIGGEYYLVEVKSDDVKKLWNFEHC